MLRAKLSKKNLLALGKEGLCKFINELEIDEINYLIYSWEVWGRKNQLEPLGNWFYWLILAGRGWG
jgi:hypothetical protein